MLYLLNPEAECQCQQGPLWSFLPPRSTNVILECSRNLANDSPKENPCIQIHRNPWILPIPKKNLLVLPATKWHCHVTGSIDHTSLPGKDIAGRIWFLGRLCDVCLPSAGDYDYDKPLQEETNILVSWRTPFFVSMPTLAIFFASVALCRSIHHGKLQRSEVVV